MKGSLSLPRLRNRIFYSKEEAGENSEIFGKKLKIQILNSQQTGFVAAQNLKGTVRFEEGALC